MFGLGGVFLLAAMGLAGLTSQGCSGFTVICESVLQELGDDRAYFFNLLVLPPMIAPALVGAFWGAPLLSREYEWGTNRLVWTQSVSVRRWLAVKLGLSAALAVVAGLMPFAVMALFYPTMLGTDAFASIGRFHLLGIAPAVWWLFAFMVGAAAGALLRRTLPAMAVTV